MYILSTVLYFNLPDFRDLPRITHRFRKTLVTLSWYEQRTVVAGKFLYVQCTLTSYNYREVLELKKFVNSEIGLPFLVVPATRGYEEGILRTRNEELADVERREFETVRRELSKFMGIKVLRNRTFLNVAFEQFLTGKKCWNCRAGELYFAVSPDGRFCICQDIETELSVLDEDFARKLRSREMKEKIENLRERCPGCTYPCYLETQTLLSHPWEAVPLVLAYLYWKLKMKRGSKRSRRN